MFQVLVEELLEFSLPDNDSYKNNSHCEGILRIFTLLLFGHVISKCLHAIIMDLNYLISRRKMGKLLLFMDLNYF